MAEGLIAKLNRKQFLFTAVIILFAAVSLILFFQAAREGITHYNKSQFAIAAPEHTASAETAVKVPGFELPDINGNTVKLSQFDSADVLIVNIWSAGCPVCRTEIPSLTELDRRISLDGDIILLTIVIADSYSEVSSYFPQGTNLRILFDGDDKVGKGIFNTSQYPETFILDRQRRIRARFDGARPWHSDALIKYFKSFLH